MSIVCPHCQHDNYQKKADWGDVPWTNDMSSENPEMTCSICSKVFWVDTVETVSWNTFATEDEYELR